jgi:hypothetical protein
LHEDGPSGKYGPTKLADRRGFSRLPPSAERSGMNERQKAPTWVWIVAWTFLAFMAILTFALVVIPQFVLQYF